MINHTIQPENVKRFVTLNHPDGVKEVYFVLIIDTEKPPWILTRYRYNRNLVKGLTSPGFFKPPMNTARLLSRGIRWLSWKQLMKIIEITRIQFRTQAERKFAEDLIIYLDYKIREAERILPPLFSFDIISK
jgi:hypothetical protein